ncbi:MAG: hypothetical protein MRERV_54c004, partial [Mycoplasmataceae bacterium RV_VA103A]
QTKQEQEENQARKNSERREREEQERLRQEAEQINQAKNSAAEEVKRWWNRHQKNGQINGQNQKKILGGDWEVILHAKPTIPKVAEEEKRLTSLITNAKAAEEQELARAETQKQEKKMRQDKADKAINELKNHWKSQQDDNNKINEKTEITILGENWEDNFRSLATEKIDIEFNNLKRLIDNEKLTEREITITDYDNLWEDIQKATKQEELNVLNDRINELNYGNLPPEKKQVFLEELQKNQRVKIWQDTAIEEVENYWIEQADSVINGLIDGKPKWDILLDNWQKLIRDQTAEGRINQQRDILKGLITNAKNEEKRKIAMMQNSVIKGINELWSKNEKNGKINNKSQNDILGSNWQNDIETLNSVEKINEKNGYFINLIKVEKIIEGQGQKKNLVNFSLFGGKEKTIEEEWEKLNKGLKELYQRTWIGLFYKKDMKSWFNNLVNVLSDNHNQQFLEQTVGETWAEKKEKILEELKKQMGLEIGSNEEFKKNFYFNQIIWDRNETNQYLRKIIKTIEEREADTAAVKEIKEYWNQASFQMVKPADISNILGTNWEHKKQIRKKKEFFINKIRVEEAKQFLEKALKIAELEMSELEGSDFIAELCQMENSEQKIINFRISAFKEIVEKGINRALKNKNPHVPYNKLTGDPKSSILQENSEQDKLNAFAETLIQIKTKRQKVAEDLLQELINEETPNNHSELQNYLNNLQRLIPHNNNVANRAAERKNSDNTDIKLSVPQIEAYRSKKNDIDKKELKLIHALALFEDDENKLWTDTNPCGLTIQEKQELEKATKNNIQKIKKNIRQNRKERWNKAQEKVNNYLSSLNHSIKGIDQTEISENLKKLSIILLSKDKPEEIKALSVLGNLPENSNWEKRTQNRINELKAEIAKWEKIKSDILSETELDKLEKGGYWDSEIESLREYLLTSDKQKHPLESKRNKRYKELEKINKSIKKMGETKVWKELKELYQQTINEINNFMTTSEGREKLSKKNFVAYTSLNPQNLFNQAINKIQESIRNCSSAEEIDNQLEPAIKELEKDLNNKIYGLKPATDQWNTELREALERKKEELVFCQRFRSQTGVKSKQIADNDILPYLSTGLTAERAANAYSFFNPQQRILVKEIINKQAIFAGRTYDLQTDNGLKKAQAAKLFLHDFHSQKGTKFEIDDKRILDYQEVGITGKQAFNAYQQGWKVPDQIRINNGKREINVGTGWWDYDWEKETFTKALYLFDKDYNKMGNEELIVEIQKLRAEIWSMKDDDGRIKKILETHELSTTGQKPTKSGNFPFEFLLILIVGLLLVIFGYTALTIKRKRRKFW